MKKGERMDGVDGWMDGWIEMRMREYKQRPIHVSSSRGVDN